MEASKGVGPEEGGQPDGTAESGQAGAGAGGGHPQDTPPSAHGGPGQKPEQHQGALNFCLTLVNVDYFIFLEYSAFSK